MAGKTGKIGDILLRLGYVREADIEKAVELQKAEGGKRKLGEILTELFLSKEDLARVLAMQGEGYSLDTSLDIVSNIMKQKLGQDQIRTMLNSLTAKGKKAFVHKIADILEKVTSFIDVSNQIADVLSLDVLLEKMVTTINGAIGADRSSLFLNDKQTHELFSRIAMGEGINEIRFPNHLGIAGSVFTSANAVIIDDAYADPRFNQEVDKKTGYRTRNILCAPIRAKDSEIIGVVQVLNKEEGDFDTDDLTLLEALTSQASAALQNAQLFDQLQKSMEEEKRMREVMGAISTELQLQPLLKKIMETITDLLDADRSTLFVNDEKTNELWAQIAQGLEVNEIRFPNHLGIAGSVFTTGETINIPEAYEDDRFNPAVDKQTGYRTKTILCMPVTNKEGKIIGVTQVLNKKGGPFTAADETRLAAFTSQASVALENATLFDEVLRMKNYSESMLESMSNGVITLDDENKIVKCNSPSLRILKTEEEDITGKMAAEYFTDKNAWIAEHVAEVFETGEQDITMDTEMFLEDETPISVNLTIVPLKNAKDEMIGSMIIFEDITTEKRVKGTMARYMTKEVADKLLEEGEDALGGQAQDCAILFSDIRSFTTISEKLGAADTVSMLNEYFTVMVDSIFNYNGILDKFIGDAIMAVFGAPFSTGRDADNALSAAIEMMRNLRKLNEIRTARGDDPIDIGIGIDTNEVISGNIGSNKRMDYTVIGDGVNLASRLEGATKQYKAKILITETTFNKLKGKYLLRRADDIQVKGQTRPVGIYEALDFHKWETFPNVTPVVALFNKGIDFYQSHQWEEAIEKFEKALSLNPNDGLSQIYVERCRYFMENPPATDWDGVWIMTTK